MTDAGATPHVVLAELIARMLPSRQGGNPKWEDAERVLADAGLIVVPTELLDDLVDPDECWHDHHGYCQAHGWMETEPRCPHARARELLPPTIEDGETSG